MFNKKPMKILQTYLEVTTSLVKNSAAKENSIEEYVLQTALLDALIDKITLTRNDVNGNMLNALAEAQEPN